MIGPEVELGPGVEVGPFCVLEGKIRLGAGTRLISHVSIFGVTEMGSNNVVHPGAVIGDEPQDTSYRGGPRAVRIGDRNVFREGVTVHRGSEQGEVTVLGNDGLLMANAHVGHDCRVGNSVILVNGALLGGWVEVGDGAFVSGNSVVHQYCRVGRLALLQGGSTASMDVTPFCIMNSLNTLRGVNVVGLRRAGFSADAIASVHKAYAVLFGVRRNLKLAIERLVRQGGLLSAEVREMIEFIRTSKRGVAFGAKSREGLDGE